MLLSSQRTPSNRQRNFSPSKQQMSTTCFEKNHNGSISFADLSSRLSSRCQKIHHRQQLEFKPQIHQIPMELYPQKYPSAQLSKQQIYERLIEDATLKIRERMIVKLQNEQQKQKQCTFHPQISDYSQYLKNLEKDESVIFDRLFQQAGQREKVRVLREEEKLHEQMQVIANLQKPIKKKNIFLNEEKHNLDPLYKRVKEVVAKKIYQRKNLQDKICQERDQTFEPKINQRSEQIIKKKIQKDQMKKNVVDRLMAEHQKYKKRQQQLKLQYQQKKKAELPFSPATSNPIANFGQKDFLSRLKQNMLNKCCHEDSIYPFAPKINKLSNMMVEYCRGKQNQNEQLYRLSYQPLEKRQILRKEIQNQMYGQFRYNPEINEISSKSNCRKKKHRCQIPVQQVYSFRPKINEQSRMIRSRSSESAKLKKKKKEIEYRCEAEYRQMKQCTFRPQLNLYRHQGFRTLGDVQGVTEYLQHTQRAWSKKRYLEQVSQKLFKLQKRYDKRRQRMKQNCIL